MVTKIISVADIHFKPLKGINELKSIVEIFIKDCKAIAKKEGKNNVRIVVAGDIFDNKIGVTNESIIAVHWFLKQLNSICKTVVIAGNHDFIMGNKDRVDSLTPIFEIGDLPNVVYLDKELGYKSGCYVDDNIVWSLFSSFEGFNTPNISIERAKFKELGEKKTYVGLIHGDVNGAITCTNRVTEKGLDPNTFEDCDFVIAGHIHKRQEIKANGVKIVYCSSLKQKDMGESITSHGYVVWDLSEEDEYNYQFKDVVDENGGYFKFSIYGIDDVENDFEELINL